jgi:hypothetical protein
LAAAAVVAVRAGIRYQTSVSSVCYVDSTDHPHNMDISPTMVFRLYPVPFVVALVASVLVLVRVASIFRRSTTVILPERRQALRRGMVYVVAYGTQGLARFAVATAVVLIVVRQHRGLDPHQLLGVAIVENLVFFALYVVEFAMVLYTLKTAFRGQKSQLTANETPGERMPLLQTASPAMPAPLDEEEPKISPSNINRSLRDDVMLCSLFGIIASLNKRRSHSRRVIRQKVRLRLGGPIHGAHVAGHCPMGDPRF